MYSLRREFRTAFCIWMLEYIGIRIPCDSVNEIDFSLFSFIHAQAQLHASFAHSTIQFRREREREKTECNEQSMVWFCYFYRSATSLVDNGFSSLIRVSLCYMLLHIALLHNGAANLISTLQLTSIKYISVRERATKKRDFALHHILTRTRDIQRIQYAYNGCANERRRVWCFTP